MENSACENILKNYNIFNIFEKVFLDMELSLKDTQNLSISARTLINQKLNEMFSSKFLSVNSMQFVKNLNIARKLTEGKNSK